MATSGDKVSYAADKGKMRVIFTGDTRSVTTRAGTSTKLEKSKEYLCTEKEYHSGMTVYLTLANGDKVKVKRGELQKA